MGQMIVVEESEYNKLKRDSEICKELIEEINKKAKELYPNIPYWIDTGSNVDVAFVQLEEMKQEIINKRKSFWKGRK